MSYTIGKNFRVTLFGQSHAEEVGCVIEGITPGMKIDYQALDSFMKRRQGGKAFTTPRKESDSPEFISGIGPDGSVCEAPLVATLKNSHVDSEPYAQTRHIPRPSHADFVSYLAYDQHEDWRGGGSFSARLSAPLCIAGALAKQILNERNISVDAHLLQVGNVVDDGFAAGITYPQETVKGSSNTQLKEQIKALHSHDFPCINQAKAHDMQKLIAQVHNEGDSIGASIECVVEGLPIGVGEPFFDGIDAQLAHAMFALPAVKSFEMGAGSNCVYAKGSEFNDPINYISDTPTIVSNNAGGSLGGLTTGMPLVFKTGFKPTPTIAKPQKTIDFESGLNVTYSFEGKHDPCVGVRAVSVVEAMASIVILDSLMSYEMHQAHRSSEISSHRSVFDDKQKDENREKVVGLIGRNLSHSLSPLLHEMISGQPYNLYDLDEPTASLFIKNQKYDGLNVTIPYKEMARRIIDVSTGECSKVGATNTLIRDGDMIVADNTDYYGFLALLESFLSDKLDMNTGDLRGKKVIVLGNGGAAKAVEAVLKDLGAKAIIISRRGNNNYSILDSGAFADACLLVNATPVGMAPNAPASPIKFETLEKYKNLQGIIDLIYNPETTLLGFWARKLDIPYTSGMLMLVEQGIRSARMFGTISADKEIDAEQIAHELTKRSKNIVLIGMPSAGKSTVGRILAKKLNRPFVDTDELFEEKNSMSPAEYIEEYGEDSFRNLESEIVREVSNRTGHVISCGGGVVCREENLYPLQQNSVVVYLKRPIRQLTPKGRPISSHIGIKKLYQARKDLYESFATIEIDVQDTPELTAEEITAHLMK